MGGLGFALLCYVGFSLAPASHGGVPVHGCLPHFTFAILWSTRTARCNRRMIAGVMLIAVGVVAMMGDTRALVSLRPGGIALFAAAVPGLTGLVAVPLMGEIPGLLAIAGMIQTTLGMLVGLTGATGTPRHAVRNRFPSAFAGKTGRSRD